MYYLMENILKIFLQFIYPKSFKKALVQKIMCTFLSLAET